MTVTISVKNRVGISRSTDNVGVCVNDSVALPMQVAVLFRRIGPYHFARLRQAGTQLNVTVLEASSVDNTYAWDQVAGADCFRRITLFDHADSQAIDSKIVVKRVHSVLKSIRPDVVVIPGWSDRTALAALQWSIGHCVPAIMMSETTAWDDVRKTWREWVKSRIVKLCSSALVGGQPHAEYIAQLGMPPENVFTGYDAVDNHYFALAADRIRQQETQTRAAYKLPRYFFLASARFIEKKNLIRLIQAYACYRDLASKQNFNPWHLVLLGDGELRPGIEQLVDELKLGNSVQLPGFKQYDELPVYYGLAGAFIHASTVEQWGLVVNEAMASGLPVLVSNRCGCSADLVREGQNGFTFDPYDIEQMATLMSKLGAMPEQERQKYGKNSQLLIADWGLDAFARGMARAIEVARQMALPRVGMIDRLLLGALIRL